MNFAVNEDMQSVSRSVTMDGKAWDVVCVYVPFRMRPRRYTHFLVAWCMRSRPQTIASNACSGGMTLLIG